MAAPAFSVVVPAYNGTRTIAATIESIRAQTRGDFELIVVDDGSLDGTPELVESIAAGDSRIRLHRQSNQGVAGARNTGIALSSAPNVAFLDNDDLWMPGYLERAGAALDDSPEAGFAYTDAYLFDDGLARIRRRKSLEHYERLPTNQTSQEGFMLRLVEGNFIMSSLMVRRRALEDVGGFSTRVNGVDDWDLLLRLLVHGWLGVRTSEPVLVQRDRADSQSKDEIMMLERSQAVMRRLLESDLYPIAVEAAAEERLKDMRRRIKRERSRGPKMAAIRLRRKLIALRNEKQPERDWLSEPPPEIARAFPDIAESYGRGPRAR